MPVLIASGADITNNPLGVDNDCKQMFVMGDGRRVAFYGSGTLHVVTSMDGVTWSSPTALTAATATASIALLGTTFWFLQGDGTVQTATYSSGTGLVTAGSAAPCSATLAAFIGAANSSAFAWDGSSGDDLYGAAGFEPSSSITLFHVGSTSTSRVDVGSTGPAANAPSVQIEDLAIKPGTSDTVFVLYISLAALFVYVATYPGGSGSAASFATTSPEQVAVGFISEAACVVNASGQLEVVWMDNAGHLYASTRTGTGVYSVPVNIANAGNVSFDTLSLTSDAGGLLRYFYSSVTNFSQGELYGGKRLSGIWQSPVLLAGGSSAGFYRPKATPQAASGRIDLLYQGGSSVYYLGLGDASAPSAPTITVSPLTTLTPTIAGAYTNSSAPSDAQGGRQVKIIRNSDAVVMWNSGMMSAQTSTTYGVGSATGDADYVAPVGLSYSVAYTAYARDEESSGPPLIGPYSSGTVFTLVQGGTVTITQLIDNGVTDSSSPATITAATIDSITASWSQPQTHGATQYQDTLTDGSGHIIAQTAATTIAGGLASGSSYTSASWAAAGLVNSSTYYLVRGYLDGTTGVWSNSASWTIHTAWTPPSPPSAFTAVWVEHPGYTYLTWTNPGAAASATLERSLAGANDWVTISTGSLTASVCDLSPLEAEAGWDWRVSIADATGIQSGYATVSGVLATPDGIFGAILVDSSNPAVWCHFGAVNDWKQASTWDEPTDSQQMTPFGALKPKVTRRFLDYSEAKQREFAVPPDGPYFSGGQDFYQQATIQTLRAMAKSGNDIWYRDINAPEGRYVQLMNVQRSISQDGSPMVRVQWDMVEVNGPGGEAKPSQPFVLTGVTGPPLSPDGSVAGNFAPFTTWPGN